jgi:hypothetical protein
VLRRHRIEPARASAALLLGEMVQDLVGAAFGVAAIMQAGR